MDGELERGGGVGVGERREGGGEGGAEGWKKGGEIRGREGVSRSYLSICEENYFHFWTSFISLALTSAPASSLVVAMAILTPVNFTTVRYTSSCE